MTTPALTFAELTTMGVGGAAARMVSPATEQDLVDQALEVWASGDDWLVLGGGSNTIVADEGFDGTVIRVLTRGVSVVSPAVSVSSEEPDRLVLRVQAGEPWDELVDYTVARGWAGIEALSGIPGSTGAAPVQNIGAYGQELGTTLAAIDFLDYETGERRRLEVGELALGYRTSALKQGLRGLVIAVELNLHDTQSEASVLGSALSRPVAFAQLATALGVQLGDRVPLVRLRDTVLALRAAKGMVLDPNDPDTRSAGSFFTNPIVSLAFSRTLPDAVPRWPLSEQNLPDRVIPLDEYAGVGPIPGERPAPLVKLSAAWLIEHSGIGRGFRLPGSRAAISSKHTLALTNTGGATADEIAQLARLVEARVQSEFGVILQPEPILIGLEA
ncbi:MULTISPECIES: UDP-N-acetylmuramate dehydrogenase [Cryobacterium]|uniref:UDP-N-acetylenolpyruvoylglucosamine reductase n=1 Tax=Cryobacterium breve TaxID=1259258 RepID=A0ABY2J2R1_9MICO|nr:MULTISPECIES: UDP-N-acetylmuramate dehydrogenase [Cryobacterium]TFC96001.1 UDP-N-acetylmuramate dehydrogenase [Cryobacterium sp. TmT3-12]TFC97973.1 UDP-N-acetylmuramate dehydrogenase [Cryobacterium breve]